MREAGGVVAPGGPFAGSRPSSSQELAGARPRSGSSSGPRWNSSSSMMRLPDEDPALVPATGTPIKDTAAAARSSRRPSNSQQGGAAALVRLGSEENSSSAAVSSTSLPARPSSSGSHRASLQRLSDNVHGNPGGQDQLQAPAVAATSSSSLPATRTSLSGVAAQGLPPQNLPPSERKSKLRERLGRGLTVTTIRPAEQGQPAKVFRVLSEDETILDYYDFEEEIYSGGTKGRVCIARRRSDSCEVVVKIRAKNANRTNERAWRTIMSQVTSMGGSNHVLNILEIIEGGSEFYVVMPKCNGGELFEFLATETEVPEAECKRILREILIAVGHLHKNNLIHRDIKPENIMFDLQNGTLECSPKTVKLIDFDTCLEWSPATPKSRRFVGTPGYIAPEALLGQIAPQSDLWSVGVILYILMTGEMPWSSLVSLEDGIVGSPGATKMYDALKSEVLEWDQDPWPEFPLARDLCQKLLAFKIEERLQTVEEALSHSWLKDC